MPVGIHMQWEYLHSYSLNASCTIAIQDILRNIVVKKNSKYYYPMIMTKFLEKRVLRMCGFRMAGLSPNESTHSCTCICLLIC